MSNNLSGGPDGALETAIGELLRQIPNTWQTYKPDDLSETRGKALSLLTIAGLVERRERMRFTMGNHPMAVDATFTFTGEYGIVEAADGLIARLWESWESVYIAWKKGPTASAPASHCERLEPSEWRLTEEGVMALDDLNNGRSERALNFTLKRGSYSKRESVRGKGSLVQMCKTQTEGAAPIAVRIVNWDEGINRLPKVLDQYFAKMYSMAPQAAKAAPPEGNGKEGLVSWMQEDLDKAIAKYKAERAVIYNEVLEGIRNNRPGAKKDAKKIFGRNAIANALGVKARIMVSRSPVWIEMARELRFELQRDKTRGPRDMPKPGKVGFDIAVERASSNPGQGDENAPVDEVLERAERDKTIRLIDQMARFGKSGKERAKNKKAAQALRENLERGECTDEQARQIVELVLERPK